MEYINLTLEEQNQLKDKLTQNGYVFNIGFDIDAVKQETYQQLLDIQTARVEELNSNKKMTQETPVVKVENNNHTIVSGLWNLHRPGRDFSEHYIERFKEFLRIPSPMILFLPKELTPIVWGIRDHSNTSVRAFELEDIKKLYEPHWNNTQQIRKSEKWRNITGEGGWLKDSPQATLEYYNPIVQSKMFLLHDASIWNNFDTEYFYWLDAGITNTVPVGDLVHSKVLNKLPQYSNPFLFLSYPYESAGEIHGFDQKEMDRIAGKPVKYVCRGGLFGGHREAMSSVNSTYYTLLQNTLSSGFMGTEESLFSIMAHKEPSKYRRFMLDQNGLIVKFTEALTKDTVRLEPTTHTQRDRIVTKFDLGSTKTNLYILTFNFPEQLLHTISQMEKQPEWLEKPSIFLLDNSTDKTAKAENRRISEQKGFTYIDLKKNTGICGGRQAAAEHFDKSDADYMMFFEDDMTINSQDVEYQTCRNGFRTYIPNLYELLHKIMLKEKFDFLKLSFTEVYMDNHVQCSWYNIPQSIRTRDFSDYDQLPIHGLDPNSPRTLMERIDVVDGLSYITGEIYYANWPMIVSKEGNKKMFIDTKWDNPFEQTWMSHMYQETKKGNLKPAVLLASPIYHERIKYYEPEERREN